MSTSAQYYATTRPLAFTLHGTAIVTLGCLACRIGYTRFKRKWSMFWILVELTSVALMITSAFEIAYAAISWSGFPVPYTPMHTFGGDISCRIGMLGMTGVRLYRLTLSVDKSHVRRTMAVLAVTTIALLTSFGVTVWLRIREYAHMNPRTLAVTTDAELVNIRAIESLVTFVVFLILNLVSLGGDIAFNLVVIHSAKQLGNETTRLQQIKDGLVYVPSMCVNIAYFTIVCWARLIPSSDPNSRMLQYFGIMLSRFAPSLEMIVFLGFTIEQTNKILRQRRPSSRQSSKQSHGKSLSGRAWSTASWKKESGAPGGSAAADTAHSIMATRSADAGGTSRYGQSEANIYPRQQTEASIGVAGPK